MEGTERGLLELATRTDISMVEPPTLRPLRRGTVRGRALPAHESRDASAFEMSSACRAIDAPHEPATGVAGTPPPTMLGVNSRGRRVSVHIDEDDEEDDGAAIERARGRSGRGSRRAVSLDGDGLGDHDDRPRASPRPAVDVVELAEDAVWENQRRVLHKV